MYNIAESIIDQTKQAIATKLSLLYKEDKLIAKKDGKIIEIKSIKEIQILNCEDMDGYNFNGICRIETAIDSAIHYEDAYRFNGIVEIHNKLNNENEIIVEVKDIVDNTIFVSKYLQLI